MKSSYFAIALALATLAAPAWAGDAQPVGDTASERNSERSASQRRNSSGSDIGYRGWGLRAGLADDIDQVLFGAHFNMGEFTRDLRFQPDVQLGVGDDHTTLFVTAPVYYRFVVDQAFAPYVGGGPTAGWIDHDRKGGNGGDDGDFEIGAKLTGGIEWSRSKGRAFLIELNLGFGDVHDVQALAGWSF